MYSQEKHGPIALYVISPKDGKESDDSTAMAFVSEIFHDDVDAGEIKVELPARIGRVLLREGHVVHGMGNKGAHTADELHLDLHSLYCDTEDSWLDAEHGRVSTVESHEA